MSRTLLPFARRANLLTILIAGPSTAGIAVAQQGSERIGSVTAAQLQRLVDEAAAASGAVGVQVSVILGDQRADLVSGSANIELGLPMTVETVIQIGSTTKIFNAALVMILVEEGKLELDRPVKTWISDLDIADDAAERAITLRQLLSMSSGIDNGPYTDHGGGDDGLARYVASLDTLPQAFRPGTGWGYSNAGTSIAGHAAERVTGKTWDELLRERIFEPAGLRHAVTRARDLPFQRVSVGHTPARAGQKPAVVRPWYITQAQGPAGSTLAMSAQDLASFGQIFLRAGTAANGARILSEASVRAMMTPVVEVGTKSHEGHWCIGFQCDRWSGTPVFGHAGGNQSGTSYLKILPERRGVLAVTVNTPAALADFAVRIFDGIGSSVFNATPAKLARPAAPFPVRDPERYIGTYAMLGTTYTVTFDGNDFWMEIASGGDGRAGARPSTVRHRMVPLERDIFLLELAPSQLSDVGFFGTDGEGRATNLTAPVLPAKRVPTP